MRGRGKHWRSHPCHEMLATRTVLHFLSDHQSWALLGGGFLILRLTFWNELEDVKLIIIILNLLNHTNQRHSRCEIFQTCLCYGKKLDEDKVLKARIKPMFAVCNMTCTEFTNAKVKEQYLSVDYHLFLSPVWDWYSVWNTSWVDASDTAMDLTPRPPSFKQIELTSTQRGALMCFRPAQRVD